MFLLFWISVTGQLLWLYSFPSFSRFGNTIANTIAGISSPYRHRAITSLYVEDWQELYANITHPNISKPIVIGDMGLHSRGITTRPTTWPCSADIRRVGGAHPRNWPYVRIRLWPNPTAAFDSVRGVIECHGLSSFLNISIGRDCLSGDLDSNTNASGGYYSGIANAADHSARTTIWGVNIPLQDGTLGAYQLLSRKGGLLAHLIKLPVHRDPLFAGEYGVSSSRDEQKKIEYEAQSSPFTFGPEWTRPKRARRIASGLLLLATAILIFLGCLLMLLSGFGEDIAIGQVLFRFFVGFVVMFAGIAIFHAGANLLLE